MEKIEVRIRTPHDPFSTWMNDHLNIDFKFGKLGDYRFVSNFISDEEIKNWNHETPVFISTQTGTGKNFFIEWALHEFSQMENNNSQKPKILLLLNRTALSRQTKIRIANRLNDLRGDSQYLTEIEKHSAEGLDELHDFGPFEIYTYHQIEEKEILEKLQGLQLSYVICDECHFFTSDSLINEKTAIVMNSIVRYFYGAVRIYMSATPEVAFEPIVKEEVPHFGWFIRECNEMENKRCEQERNEFMRNGGFCACLNYYCLNRVWPSYYQSNYGCTNYQCQYFIWPSSVCPELRSEDEKLHVKYYYIERDYSYICRIIDLHLGNIEKKIEELIKKGQDSEKWLIFIHSKATGEKLTEYLNRKFGDGFAVLITSDEKESETFKEIVEEEKFSCRVLVATAVLDNGISINDENVKHVVIDIFDRVQFLQMLGRVRVNKNGQKINLYVIGQDDQHIETLMSYSLADLVLHIMYDELKGDPRQFSFVGRRLNKGFAYDDKEGFFYSLNALYELVWKITELRRIMRKITGMPEYKISMTFNRQKGKAGIDDKTKYAKAYNFCKEIYDRRKRDNLWDRIYDAVETEDRLKYRKELAERRNKSIFKITNEDVFYHHLINVMLKYYENEYFNACERKKEMMINKAAADEKDKLAEKITWLEEKLEYIGEIEQSLNDTIPDKNAAVAEYAYWLGRKPEEIEDFDMYPIMPKDENKVVAETEKIALECESEPNNLPKEISSDEQAIALLDELAISITEYEAAKGSDKKNALLLKKGCLKEEEYLDEVYNDDIDDKKNEKIRQQKFDLVWDYYKACTKKKKVDCIKAEKDGVKYEGKSEQLHTGTKRTIYYILKYD